MTRMPAAVVEQVFERDRRRIAAMLALRRVAVDWDGKTLRALAPFNFTICPAVLIDVTEFGKCWGRWTIEHVKSEPRLGVRAENDLEHCLGLCEGHTEPGMKAGFIWNTANRPAIRQYLAEANA